MPVGFIGSLKERETSTCEPSNKLEEMITVQMDFFSNLFSCKLLGYAASVNVDKEIKIKRIYLTDLSSEALFFHHFEGKVGNISYDKVNSDISSTASSVESLKSCGRL